MNKNNVRKTILKSCLFSVCAFAASAHAAYNWYFSWGYNKDYWSNSDIHISQPGLRSDFVVNNVAASDDPGWTNGLFNTDLMSPQYNIRLGRYLNKAQTWAVELNFDHTKYNTNYNQIVYVNGVVNGAPYAGNYALTKDYFSYMLHNGFNNLMLNVVRRKEFAHIPKTNMKLYGIAKVGAGVLLPHPMNTIMGNTVNVGPKAWGNYFGARNGWWQLGGWTTGVELGLQLSLYKTIYAEITNKEAYNSLSDIQVYQGRADQTVWLNETIFSLGTAF